MTSIFIDKISLTFNIKDKEHQKFIAGQLIDLPKDIDSGWTSGQRKNYRYAARLHASAPTGGPVHGKWTKDYVLLQAAPRNGEGGYLRAEWNPARFAGAQAHYLISQLDDVLDLPPPELGKANVTRADITVDLPGVCIRDFVFERSNSPIRRVISRAGELQTLYFGTKASGQVCIYDKGAHLGDQSLVLTRVEVHTRPNRPAAELATLKNPFSTIRAYDVMGAVLDIGKPHQRTLARAAQHAGIQAALRDFPAAAAAGLQAALLSNPAPFWKPEQLWETWPAAIKAALPTFGNPAHYGSVQNEDFAAPNSPSFVTGGIYHANLQ